MRDAADFGEPSSGAAKDARDFSPDASRQAEASRLKPLPHPSRHHQRGAMAITIAIMLLGLIFMLGLVEIGYLYWAKRDTQKVADLAALSGAQRLDTCIYPEDDGSEGNYDNTAARANAADDNGFTGTLNIACGSWQPLPGGGENFIPGRVDANAVRVEAQRPVIPILGFIDDLPDVSATAIAVPPSLASFWVGTTLLRVSGDSTLGALLGSLGLDVDGTSLLGYEGLAQIRITPGGLLKELGIPVTANIGIGELNTLLAARTVDLGELLDAVVTLAGQDEFTNLKIDLLEAIDANIGDIPLDVQLGSLSGQARGLFAQIVAPDHLALAALNTQVRALDLVAAAVGVATSRHAIEADLSVAHVVKVQAGIVEPPSIAVGGVGTSAYTAQVRTYIHVDTGEIPLLGGLLNNIVRLNLPIVLDAVDAKGTLERLCEETDGQGRDLADISVDASILKVCIGGIDEDTLFSTSQSCEDNLQNAELLNVLGLIKVNTKLAIDALPANGTLTLYEGQTDTVGNELLLGTTVRTITDAILGALLGGSLREGQRLSDTGPLKTSLATDIWNKASVGGGTRKAKLQRSKNLIDSAGQNLSGFVGSLPTEVTDLLSDILTLDVLNLLNNVGGLVGGLLDAVTSVLEDLLDLLTDPCTRVLFPGPESSCIDNVAKSIAGNSGSSVNQVPNSVIATTGFLFNLLQPILDGIGSNALTPVLQNVLGLKLGLTDVGLISLECKMPDDSVNMVY